MNTQLPDLHNQAPPIELAVQSVGHRGIKRLLVIDEYDSPAMLVFDIAIGLRPDQRGAHMSRLIDCIPLAKSAKSVRTFAQECIRNLRELTPDATMWSLDLRATSTLALDDGQKPMEEIVNLLEKPDQTSIVTWGVGFKVCLACPQGQAAVAHDHGADESHGYPSHNQLCELEMTITEPARTSTATTAANLLELGESIASGPVREKLKRRGEADSIIHIHNRTMFAEDALRELALTLRNNRPEAIGIKCEILNYESIFEYPLHCIVTA